MSEKHYGAVDWLGESRKISPLLHRHFLRLHVVRHTADAEIHLLRPLACLSPLNAHRHEHGRRISSAKW